MTAIRKYLIVGAILLLPLSCAKKEVIKPEEAAKFTAEGWNLFEAGKLSQAVDKFNQALGKDPHFTDAYNGRGWCKALLKDYQDAEQDWLIATGIDPGLLEPYAGLALLYNAINEYNSCITAAQMVLSQAPDFVFSHNFGTLRVDAKVLRLVLAQSLFYMGQYEAARDQLDLLDPDNAPHSADPALLLRQIQNLWGQI